MLYSVGTVSAYIEIIVFFASGSNYLGGYYIIHHIIHYIIILYVMLYIIVASNYFLQTSFGS